MADPTVPNPMVPQDPSMEPGAPGVPVQPPSKPGFSLRSPLITGIAGLVVGAVVVGVPWLMSGDASPFGAEKTSLTAPVTFGGFTQVEHNPRYKPGSLNLFKDSNPQSAKNLSAAYGGAAVVVESYADVDLANFLTLEAVRARSPLPYVPYVDARDLGLAKPEQEIVAFGDVECLVVNEPAVAASQPDTSTATAVTCERTSAHLTVRLRFSGGGDVAHSPAQAAALVDTAWGLLS